MEEKRLELKVGLLIALAIAGCVGLLYLLGELQLGGGKRVTVDFAHSGGVPEGAPVKIAGVRVGRILSLELLPARRDPTGRPLPIRMQVEIADRYFADLRADALFLVATQGPLGEPFLEIEPGSATAPPLASGASLRGRDPARMDLLSSKLMEFLDAVTVILGDPEDLQHLLASAKGLTRQAELLLEENGPVVTRATHDLADAARELKALSSTASAAFKDDGDARRLLADLGAVSAQLRRDLPAITEKAQSAIEKAAVVAASIGPEDVRQIKEAVTTYQRAGEQLNAVAAKVDRMLVKVEAGEGTLGALAQDPKLYEDIRALVTDLKRHPWKVFWKQ